MTDPARSVVVLRPAAGRAAAWTVLGAFAIGASGWALGRAGSGPTAIVAAVVFMLAVPVTGAFALQVFAPAAWTLRLGDGRLRGFAFGRPVDVDLGDVRSLAVRRVWGDRTLVVETTGGRRRLWLPVGADARALREALAGYGPATRVRTDE